MAIFDVPQRFSRQWVGAKSAADGLHRVPRDVPRGAAARGWDEDELRELARMWAETSGAAPSTESSA
jgi:hypothetical protein